MERDSELAENLVSNMSVFMFVLKLVCGFHKADRYTVTRFYTSNLVLIVDFMMFQGLFLSTR